MDFILPLTFLIFSSSGYSILFKKNISETIPFTIIISSLTLYIFGILNILQIGFYILSISCLIFPTYLIIKHKEIKNIKPLLLNNGFYIFIILYMLIYILNLNRGFSSYDEISHWGPMVKEILRTGKLYSCDESTLLVHKDYPPIFQIWESFWCFLCFEYKETFLYKALQTACLSFFLPIFTDNSKRNILYFLLLPICLISICNTINLDEGNFGATIYLDAPIAILSAYCIYLTLKTKKSDELNLFYIVQITLSLSFLLLTKQIGIYFYLIAISIFIIYKTIVTTNKLKVTAILLLIIILPIGIFFSWKEFSKNSTAQFSTNKIKINIIPQIIKGTDKNLSFQHQTYLNFKNAIETQDLAKKTIIPNFNFLGASIILLMSIFILINIDPKNSTICKIFIILLFSVALLNKITYFTGLNILTGFLILFISLREDKLKSNSIFVILYLGGYAYALAMMILYFFCFSVPETLRLASFTRYMNTYLFYLLAITSMLFFEHIQNSKKIEKNLVFFLACITIFNIAKSEINLKIPYKNNSITNKYLEDSKIIESKTKENDKIHIISQGNDGSAFFTLSYLTSPRKYNIDNFSLGKQKENYIFIKEIKIKDFSKLLIEENYKYLYIQKIDENFIENYATMFKDKNPQEKNIYKIEKQNKDNVMFVKD